MSSLSHVAPRDETDSAGDADHLGDRTLFIVGMDEQTSSQTTRALNASRDPATGEDVERFLYRFPGETNRELEAACFDGKPLWLTQLLERMAPGATRVQLHFREADGRVISHKGRRHPQVASDATARNQGLTINAQGVGLEDIFLDDEWMDIFYFLSHQSQVTVVSVDKAGKIWHANIRRSTQTEENTMIIERCTSSEEASAPFTVVLVQGLHHRLVRDFWELTAHHLDANAEYPRARFVAPHLTEQTQFEEVALAGGRVECLNSLPYPKTVSNEEGTRYHAVGNVERGIYMEGWRVPLKGILGKLRSFMTWNLAGFEHSTNPDLRMVPPKNFQGLNDGIRPHAFAIQSAMRRLKNPHLIQLLVHRMVMCNTEKMELLELVSLPHELQRKLGHFDRTTMHFVVMAWQELFGAARIMEEGGPTATRYASSGLTGVSYSVKDGSSWVSIQHAFPPSGRFMANGRLETYASPDNKAERPVVTLPPAIYAFLAEAGVPTEGPYEPPERETVEPPAVDALLELTRVSTALTQSSTYLCMEVDPARAADLAEALAARGIEASVLALPEPLRDALFGDRSPFAYIPEVTPLRVEMVAPRGLLEAVLAQEPPETEAPTQTPSAEERTPYRLENLVEGWKEEGDYLWQRERIDLAASHMPPGYYSTHMGTRCRITEDGSLQWENDDHWSPIEVSRAVPRRFATRIVGAELNGERRLLVRPDERIIGFYCGPASGARLFHDPRTGLYKVEGRAERFTYWTAEREAPDESVPLADERDSLITLDTLDPGTREWIQALMNKEELPSIKELVAIQKAWSRHFNYDARMICRGETVAEYVRNLLNDPKGKCAEAGEGLAFLYRLTGNPARVREGYAYGLFDGLMASHRWPEVYSGRQWMRMEGTEGTQQSFVSLNCQRMPLSNHLDGKAWEDQLKEGAGNLVRTIQGVATRRNMVRLALAGALVGSAAALVGTGMLIENQFHILGSGTSSEHP